MAKYEKYIDCEFGYTQPTTRINHLLIYQGEGKPWRVTACFHCDGHFMAREKKFHSFEDKNNKIYVFHHKCVEHAFGAGLKTLKQSLAAQ